MTREEAIAIRAQQLQGVFIEPELLQQAIATIKATNQPLTHSDEVSMRRKQGNKTAAPKKPRVKKLEPPEPPTPPDVEELPIPALTEQPCPCGEDECPADPPAVVQALKPWALVRADTKLPKPEGYPWPRLEAGVDIDRVHRIRK